MKAINEYVVIDNKKLRCGFTTGTCAAAASKAATIMLLSGYEVKQVSIMTPKGIELKLPITNIEIHEDYVSCAVQKDSGDDPDVTNGILVYSKVSKNNCNSINLDGGIGVGRVTKYGLEQMIGEAAINKVPREMIINSVKEILDEVDFKEGVDIIISVPEGIEIAKRTFNPKLGIEGGISILGTSGIVEPMSESALVASIKIEMKMLFENGIKNIVVTPGNYGEAFTENNTDIDLKNSVKCSNYIGEVLDYALELGFEGILFIGHIGKFIKLAAGIMNTHSRYADGRADIMAAHAALNGASRETVKNIMHSITTDESLDYLEHEGIKEVTMNSIIDKIHYYINNRVYGEVKVGAIVFSNKHGFLGKTENVDDLIKILNKKDKGSI